jgi:hypothetical protein
LAGEADVRVSDRCRTPSLANPSPTSGDQVKDAH